MATDAASTLRSRDRRKGSWIELFSNEKRFSHPWVGSPVGNRLGLHKARVRLAQCCAGLRRWRSGPPDAEFDTRLRRDGLLVVEDALPPALFEAARAEFQHLLAAQAKRVPVPPPRAKGFGAPQGNAWGFDRYDGGSLNRYVKIDGDCHALHEAFGDDSRLAARLQPLVGTRVSSDRFMAYLMVHGPQASQPDPQRLVHCDTFHETFKLWYFFDAVTLDQGPLRYSPGSHRNTAARLRWEQRMALERRSGSASFRISAADLAALGWPAPVPVLTPPNTLVLADTRGFHCRSEAPAGTERPCVYANLRPGAFSPSVR
jgi:hypothetical protein